MLRRLLIPSRTFAQTLTPQSAAWIRAHPEFGRDPAKNKRLVSAHNFVVDGEGVGADTASYFSRMEQLLGVTAAQPAAQPTQEVVLSDGAQSAGGRGGSPPPAAPARNGGNGSPRTVRKLHGGSVEGGGIVGHDPGAVRP